MLGRTNLLCSPRSGPFPRTVRQHATLPRPEAPSADRSRPSLFACAPSSVVRAATGTSVLPREAQLPTCVHAQRVCARPQHLPVIHRGPEATCRLSTSADGPIHEHTFEPSKPLRFLRWQATEQRAADSPKRSTGRVFVRPGVACFSVEEPPPRRRPRAAADLPQPACPGHLLSQARVP